MEVVMPAFAAVTKSEVIARVGFKKILIATDYSAFSNKAMHYGLAIARRYHSTVNLVSVVSSLGFAMAGPEAVSEAVHLGIGEAAELRKKLDDGGFLEGVSAQIDVEYGIDVAKQLLEISQKWQPDLIVLGTHGRTGLKKIWMGSVAEQVFRASSCPVLTVGPAVAWPSAQHQSPRILFPTDFSPESLKALHGCVAFAEARGSGLLLLHVAPVPRGEAAIDKARIVAGLQSRLRELLPPHLANKTHVRVEFGNVQSTICSVAEEECCSLIVMGLHGEKGLLEGRWEHAYQIVSDANCPVLTVRTIAT
jgi:nucleotide-binding universal stress UspA family protein